MIIGSRYKMDISAKWIWCRKCYEKNEYADFLLEADINEVDENAVFCISADSEYVLWINGQFVNCGQYDDYPSEKVYDTLNVGQYLHKGKNIIAITAYYQGEKSSQYMKGERGVCFSLQNYKNVFVSSKNVKCRISKTFTCGQIHKTTLQLGYGYVYNANGEDDWIYKETENSEWSFAEEKDITTCLMKRPIKKCTIEDTLKGRITAQGYFLRSEAEGSIAYLMHSDYLSHREFNDIFEGSRNFPIKSLVKENKGIYILVDLEKERCGYLTFSIIAKGGTVLDIAYGEHLKDLRVRCEVGGRNFADRYICKDGKQEFTYFFKRIAGRYIQIHIDNPDGLFIEYIGIRNTTYPLIQTGKFISEDSLHNKIFDVCIDTLKLCMHEHYEDCPWREQALYTYDSRNQALAGYYAFGEFDFAKASLELLIKGVKEKGQLNICAPTDESITIPSFSMWWILEMKEYTEYSGDMYFVDKYWHVVEKMLCEYTASMNNYIAKPPSGEIYWNFYEWSDGYTGAEEKIKELRNTTVFEDCIYNLILYTIIKCTLWLAGLSGKKDFVDKYSELLENMKESINQTFWNEEKHLYATYKTDGELFHYGELTQALALYNQICDGEKSEHLCNALINNEEIIPITLSYSVFKYESILKHNKKYAKYVFDDIAQKWGGMLFDGATSFWETLIGSEDFNGAGSLCHGWSAIPVYLYLKYAFKDNMKGE